LDMIDALPTTSGLAQAGRVSLKARGSQKHLVDSFEKSPPAPSRHHVRCKR
jgi:hypothetical protein